MADGYLNFDTKINEKGFNSGISSLGKSISSIGSGISGLGSTLTKSITAPALAAATAVAGITLSSGFSRMTNIDNARVKLEALGNSADQVSSIMADALSSVKGTAYGLDSAATTAASAVAAGIQPGQELSRYLGLVADAAAVAGTDMDSMGSVFNKVATNGKATNEVLGQLADQGIPVYQWLAEECGTTSDAIFEMASDGEISLEQFENAVEKHISGAAKTMGSKTLTGAISNIKASISRIGANLLGSSDDASTVAGQLLDLFNWIMEELDPIESKASELGKSLGSAFKEAVSTIKELVNWLQTGNANFNNMNSTIASVVTVLDPLVSKFKSLSSDQQIGIVAGLVSAGPVLSTVGKAVTSVGNGIETISKVSSGAKSAVNGLIAPAKSAKSAFDGLKTSVPSIVQNFGSLKTSFTDLTSSIGSSTGITQAFSGLSGKISSALSPVTSTISSFGSSIGSTFSGAFSGIASTITSGPLGTIGSTITSYLGGIASSVAPALSGFGSAFSTAFGSVLSAAASFLPALLSLLGVGTLVAAVVAGLGLLQQTYGDQLTSMLTMIQTKGPEMITSFCAGITEGLPELIAQGATLLTNLMTAITANLPTLISCGVSIVTTLCSGLAQQLPTLVPVALQMVVTLVTSLASNIPQLISTGLELLNGLVTGLMNALPQLIAQAPTIIGQLASSIIQNLPKILTTGMQIILKLAAGLIAAVPQMIAQIPAIISQIKNAFSDVDWGSVGSNIISGIKDGISGAVGTIIDAAKGAAQSALDAAKSLLGIHSPSRVFRDQVGKMIPEGMALGIDRNKKAVTESIDGLTDSTITAGKDLAVIATQSIQDAVDSMQSASVALVGGTSSVSLKEDGKNSDIQDLLETSKNLVKYANRPISVTTKIGAKTAAKTLAKPIQTEQERLESLNNLIGGYA